jgi:hypothetical protein
MGKVIDYLDKFENLAEIQSYLGNKHRKQLNKLTEWLRTERQLTANEEDI